MWRKVPRTANMLLSPNSPCMPIPIIINPIWETEEQASVRLKSMENSASTAPITIVATPNARMTVSHIPSCGNILQLITSTPKIPVFVRIPDKSALAGAGATGCAFGSQICSGNTPAFAPKPNNRQAAAAYTFFPLHASYSAPISSVPA